MSKKKKESVKQCQLYVEGMHCASCEVLIEKKLLKDDNIEGVDASLGNNTVNVYYKDDKPAIDDLNKEFKDLGYTFSTKPVKRDNKPLLAYKNGALEINGRKSKKLLKALFIAIVITVLFFMFESSGIGSKVSVDSNSSFPAFFVLGVVAALSSCAALVGGLLLSMTKQWNDLYIDADNTRQKSIPHILFHAGRLLGFFIFGGILALIGGAISFESSFGSSLLVIFVSVVMLILALQMLEVGWANKLRLTTPKFISSRIADESRFGGQFMPFVIGAATFFLPCGFTLIAQGIALASGEFLTGALVMLFFALGTLPILGAISFTGVQLNRKPHLTAWFNMVSGILLLLFSLYNINSQLNVLGIPSISDLRNNISSEKEETTNESAPVEDGIQILNVIAKDFDYIPTSSTTLKSGVDTQIVIDNQGIQGCGTYMAARGLIDGYVILKPGENVIKIGKPNPGTYKLTCSMGMVPPITITVN